MINREAGLTEIYNRLYDNRDTLGIRFKRTPSRPATAEELPLVFMLEETDNIIEHSKRNKTGYPARRVLEVVLEIIAAKEADVKQLYLDVRRIVFTERNTNPPEYNPILGDNVFINENRTEGPTGYGLPDVIGMRLVLDLVYTDNGF